MESSRQTWSDARMDEFAQRTEENFGAFATGFIAAVVQHFIG